ncbi:hypothetical protein P171DRAFT_445550 [Karstenula rhodostoma CBS 690.94]|uniref:Uncharacterized protein n=1 Tax=Karstenula rhodostoma CBS 690.94 TaxID=1392251 RepID=A0A9P4PDH6_9PLEO|nr:hypothetical protein P171DRAFT_445550 [Karstenula rhodostoma CBS 690.94]
MPGLFTPSPLQRCDSRPRLYEPVPRSPPVSSETSGLQVTENEHATRKRSRYDNLDMPHSTFTFTANPQHNNPWSNSQGYSRSSIRSPPPLANERYELAGGVEVTDRFARQNGNLDDYFHLEKQREMWSTPASPNYNIPPHLQPAELQVTPPSGKPRMLNQLMNIVGGVAGKLYQFWSVPFRGFQAGGGQAYSFNNQEVAAKLGLDDDTSFPNGPTQHIAPTEYRDNDYGIESIESLKEERPGAKRQRTAESWVVVDNRGDMTSRPSTPRMAARRVPGHTRSHSQIPRPASMASMATPAHKRSSLIPVSRRSTLDRTSFHGSAGANPPLSGHARSYSRQSYGSPALSNDDSSKKNSPLHPESQRLVNKLRREEVEDDARMRRMSSQMSAMLREAREALGSKFEIEDEYMDDDDDDDGLHSNSMPLFPR